jgi:dipeptidyl aminopeptidase/acylaminoacyl peptidase
MTRDRVLAQPTEFFIDRVRQRPLNGGDLKYEGLVERSGDFDVHEITYRSDDLRISGLIARPHSGEPLPAVIINHGFFPPEDYYPGKGTKHELRALASRGYLTVAPDYRNYGNSDTGDNTLVPGFLRDVRNLVPALAKRDEVDVTRIAMMGHSMGAGITLQCLATGSAIRAAALLGAVTGREAERYEARRNRWSHAGGAAAQGLDTFTERFGTPDEAPDSYERMSVINCVAEITAPIIMHHGARDEICPLSWATEIRHALEAAGKSVEFRLYDQAGHVFRDETFDAMIERTDRFFRAHMTIDP